MPLNCSLPWYAQSPRDSFIPEEFSEEQRMIATLTGDFVDNEIVPLARDIEEMKPGLMEDLLRKTGELGLLSPDIPEQWGGMGLDLISSLLITEKLGADASFAVAHTDHTVLGTLPLVWFGNEEQKGRYLPGLASGETLAAYALTEGGSGSDALAARTKAVLSADGKHYLLNGAKQFITNAGIAQLFVTYAKVDGDRFTAFLVDRDSEGLSLGAEEKKMGISGSSTRSVVYEDAKVPVENLLFEVGKGHLVAFNVLNLGRLKLAAQCLGTAKAALAQATRYALEREQFGRPIARYGMIQDKLARMATLIYITESVLYRSAARLGQALAEGAGDAAARAGIIAEYAVECSINKVLASEVLDSVVDETVQIFGGYGYSREYPADRFYRDARINRIFAGTNEINRLLIAKTMLSGSVQGQLAAAAPTLDAAAAGGPTAREAQLLVGAKRALLLTAGAALEAYGDALGNEQEILGLIADLVIQIYALESGLLRTAKLIAAEGADAAGLKLDALRSYYNDAVPRIRATCAEALAAVLAAEALREKLQALEGLLDFIPIDGIAARRRIAERVQEAGGYTA